MLLMNFSLVPEQAPRVSEALNLFTAGFFTDIRPGVLVHVFSVRI